MGGRGHKILTKARIYDSGAQMLPASSSIRPSIHRRHAPHHICKCMPRHRPTTTYVTAHGNTAADSVPSERRNAVDYVGLIERATTTTSSAGNRSRPPTLIVTNDGCGALCAATSAAVERGIAWKACKHARSTQQKGNQHERKCGTEYKRLPATCNQTANLQSTVSTKRTAIAARAICGCWGARRKKNEVENTSFQTAAAAAAAQ